MSQISDNAIYGFIDEQNKPFEVGKGLDLLGPEMIHNIVNSHGSTSSLQGVGQVSGRSRQRHSRTSGRGGSLHFIKRVEGKGSFIWLDKEQ